MGFEEQALKNLEKEKDIMLSSLDRTLSDYGNLYKIMTPEQRAEVEKFKKDSDVMKDAEEKLKNLKRKL